jgi:heme-degrading monooxygenase HmoA
MAAADGAPAPRPFRVLLTMRIRSGREQEFEHAWFEGSATLTAQPANLSHTLARVTDDPTLYHITSEWADEASFRRYEDSPEHLAHRATLHPFRSEGSMATMTVVHDLGPGHRLAEL